MLMINFSHLEEALSEFEPDLIVFIAGTDILEGDSLGLLSVTPEVKFKLFSILFTTCMTGTYC